ncbi:sortase [Paenibacillus phoenicis]|uniref:Sortase n=1 Tax=Paenibacillus phoenicis TaxID=554117 RepID=A0ABU5PQJ3_9BACL|nr:MULTISPECIES: sortase [Paenibacillus]EES74148.1 sortase family protein [Paenibacillus sp. oral taxon 786 str. D14]MCT2194967.1 sortase [Paenibacillus sp. p3-SID1389]MEA3572223.1 sortase [Paenibacillus phoenicis]
MRRKRSLLRMSAWLVFSCSLVVLAYSIYQVIQAPLEAQQALRQWDELQRETDSERAVRSADENPLSPALASKLQQTGGDGKAAAPARIAEDGELLGKIAFPSLDQRYAILEGTGNGPLKLGVGHVTGTPLPGEDGNSVLAGHRDTVFRNIGKLKAGDRIEVETAAGNFIYEVTGRRIVDEDDANAVQASTEPLLTLITCYPFTYVGPAPERLLLTAKLIEEAPDS